MNYRFVSLNQKKTRTEKFNIVAFGDRLIKKFVVSCVVRKGVIFTEIYTVSFFGHRYIDNFCTVEQKLEEIIRELIREHEYVDFLVGRDGDFDQIVSSTVKRIKRDVCDCNSSLIWVMPYPKAEYSNNQDNFEEYYDEIEVCYKSCQAHPKSAIQIRNKYMVDRSELVILYVKTDSGGAYMTMKYAERNGKKIIKL